jgi:hypothetical protein
MALHVALSSSDPNSRRFRRQASSGLLRRISPGIFTDDLNSPLDAVVRREIREILAAILPPESVVSHRSALEGVISPANTVHVTGPYRRTLELPGHKVVMRKGQGPLPGDIRIPVRTGVLYVSSSPRAMLENLTASRARRVDDRHVLGQAAVGAKLESMLVTQGASVLNQVRDGAKAVAKALGLEAEGEKLDHIIGALLGTREARQVHPATVARQRGLAYDTRRVDFFSHSATALEETPPSIPPATPVSDDELRAFVESYFSNYIEGTEFEIEEAHDIVTKRKALQYREDDSHDVIGTFNAILDSVARPAFPASLESFRAQLQSWNSQVLFSRSSKNPGRWKEKPNRAGGTQFVAPGLVQGTLAKGFELIAQMQNPAAKAALAMLVVLEVHPFSDGNGRTARLALNLALSAAGLVRIVVPTVYRDDYISSLKAFSTDGHVLPYSRMLTRAAQFSAWLTYDTKDATFGQLERSNALKQPDEGKLQFPV